MTFPLYGENFGQLASQQAGYDNFFNAIQQANASRLIDANNRNLEMAFRTREMQAQDARTLAAQDEDARRFALGLEAAAQNRADQISQAKSADAYQQMAFKARNANDAALLQLERDKLAATQAGKIDPEEQALMLSDHLGQLKDAADAAASQTAANQQRIAAVKANAERNGYKLVDDRRGNLTFVYNRQTPATPGSVTADQLNGALADAMRQDRLAQAAATRAQRDLEKNLWNAKQLGLQRGWTVGPTSIRTKAGSEYQFTPAGNTPTPAVNLPQPTSMRLDINGNVTGSRVPEAEMGAENEPSFGSAEPVPSSSRFVIPQTFDVPGFTPPPVPAAPRPLNLEQSQVLLRSVAPGTDYGTTNFQIPSEFKVPGYTPAPAPPAMRPLDAGQMSYFRNNYTDPYASARAGGFVPRGF